MVDVFSSIQNEKSTFVQSHSSLSDSQNNIYYGRYPWLPSEVEGVNLAKNKTKTKTLNSDVDSEDQVRSNIKSPFFFLTLIIPEGVKLAPTRRKQSAVLFSCDAYEP